jgi:hypothetical protein
MPFQPYPSSGNDVSPQQLPGGPAPQSVQNAIKLMYVGAALEVVGLIVAIATAGSVRSRIAKNPPKINGKLATATQIASLAHFEIALGIAGGLIGVVLWLWMARKNGQGRSWARILSTVFFVISTLSLLSLRTGDPTAITIVSVLLTWLTGLGTIVLLWLPASSPFFGQRR